MDIQNSYYMLLGIQLFELLVVCQGAVFMTAKFEVFPTLSLKTFTHFTFPLRTYQMNSLSLPSYSFILTNQDIKMDEHQWITDII